MPFLPAHKAIVLYCLDNGVITESEDGDTPAALGDPILDGNPRKVLGYTNLPQTSRGLNNSKGYAVGQQGAAYNKRGAVSPQLEIEIRPGNVAALADLFPTNGVLPYLCIYVLVQGQYCDVYRKVKPNQLDFRWSDGQGQGGELTVSAQLWATAYQRITPAPFTVGSSAIRALGTPLMWHDVREFNIEHPAGTFNNYRRSVMSVSATVNYNLERKNQRPNWGDNELLSRTSYELMEHLTEVSGEMVLHERLIEDHFSTVANAQDWGDISIRCSDSPLGLTESKGFTLTLGGAFPSDETMQSAEASAEIDHTVAFTADTIGIAVEAA